MADRIHEDFHFLIEYGEGFRDFIADSKMPGNLARVKVNNEFLIGGDDYYTESPIMGVTLTEALEAVRKIVDNEKAIIDFPDGGGTILIIEPRDEQTVTLTPAVSDDAVTDQDKRMFDSVVVLKEAVVSEIIRVCKEWRDKAIDINPNIVRVGWFQDLERAIEKAESIN